MKKCIALLFIVALQITVYAQTPRIVINAKGHTAKIQNLLSTPDGKQIISISEDKSIRFWNAENGKMIDKLEGQIGDGWEGILYASAISPDGKFLAVAGYPVKEETENYILIIDLDKKEQVSTAVGHTNIINSLAFTRDGKNLLSASDDGTVKLWGIADKKLLSNLATITVGNPITSMSYNSRTQDVALVAGGKDVLVYKFQDIAANIDKAKPKAFKKHEGDLQKVVYSPDGFYLASSSQANEVVHNQTNDLIIWNADGSIVQEIKKLDHPLNALAFSNDSKIFVGLDVRGKGYSWAVQTGAKFTEFNEHDNAVFSAVFMPSAQGHYVVASAGGINNEIILWNAFNGTLVSKIKGKGRAIRGLSFGDDMQLRIATELDKSDNPKYESVFDFNTMTFKFKVENLASIKTGKKSVQQTGENDLSVKGKTIHTDASVDGRILDYAYLTDESVVVGSDFSLKQFDKNGALRKEFVGHSGAVRAVTVSADGRYLCSGGEDQTIMLWRMADEGYAPAMRDAFASKEWQDYFTSLPVDSLTKEHSKKAWQEVISFLKANKQKAYRDIEDVYNKMGEIVIPFATLFITEDGEFVCWNPRGYFTCSSAGASYFGWHINKGINELADFYEADQYFDVLYSPEEMPKSITTGKRIEEVLKAEGKRVFDLTKLHRPSAALFSSQQDASILKFEKGVTYTEATKIPLTVNIHDGGGGIKELNIFQNDKLIVIDKDIATKGERDVISKTYMVDMANEVNEFKVKAINFQKIESHPDVFTVEYRGQAIATSTLHILSVGVNKYTNSSYNLNYAQPDAQSFTEAFVKKSESIFKKIDRVELYDENATKANIAAKFNTIIAQAKPEDVFLFYYAGHGSLDETNNDEYYFVPTDVTKLYGDQDQLSKRGISATELKNYLAQIKAQKQIILMDACHSGGAVKTLNVRAAGMDEKAIVQLARSSGVVMIASSGSKQFATEFDQLKHGVFTYALLEALDGKADNGDKKITVNELKLYMEERVPELTKQYGGKAQYPTGYITGNDFPISIMEK